MRIFVTGGAGFIGGNFILKQINEGNEILNYDKLTYAGNLSTLSSVTNNSNYKFINGDICDDLSIKNALNSFQPNVIVKY